MIRFCWSGVALPVLSILLMGGCDRGRTELEEQRRQWRETRPESYAYSYTVTGFSPGGGPWRIEVRGDQVQSVTYEKPDPAPVVGLSVQTAPTIEALFDQIEQGLSSKELEVTVTYDSNHIPVEAWFDGGEEGWGFTAKQFTPVPMPAQ